MAQVKSVAANVVTAALARSWRLPPKLNGVRVTHDIPVPMRDGVVLLADHHAPDTRDSRPTLLMRSPYGRGSLHRVLLSQPYAERGYHVVLQSTRGTWGSGGVMDPGHGEVEDGQDTIAWLRQQSWFDGRLVAAGISYLGYTAWSLAADPPPELKAMVIALAPHDMHLAAYGQGPFQLSDMMRWSELLACQEDEGVLKLVLRALTAGKRLAPAMNRLPLVSSAEVIGGNCAPWYRQWINHAGYDDPYWNSRRASAALANAHVPVLLFGGLQDFFLDQTLAQYQALREGGAPVSLTLGPWTHMALEQKIVIPQTLSWMDHHVGGNGPVPRRQAVRFRDSATGTWHTADCWPPPTDRHVLYLHPSGRLESQAPPKGRSSPPSSFRYDPAKPTPAVGGRTLAFDAGAKDNSRLEERPDTLVFTTGTLTTSLKVAGTAILELHARSDNPHADLFARLCDVDRRGVSTILTDRIVRLASATTGGESPVLHLELTGLAYTFKPGHRIRLYFSGGAHPRYARNTDKSRTETQTATPAATTWRIHHSHDHPSILVLPEIANDSDARI
ncbi:CocE/NonD family hydrolase [Streptomyces sp. NPDC051577]|uniref:CocE/NonD family hydrolase n=1 Tax=Streptomyces sp. NPDC051577 TaxID=3155166 RepID=UPI003425C91B